MTSPNPQSSTFTEETWDTGDLRVTEIPGRVDVEVAPQRITISLALLVNCQGIRITADTVYIGSPEAVGYRVVDVQQYPLALRCERIPLVLPQDEGRD